MTCRDRPWPFRQVHSCKQTLLQYSKCRMTLTCSAIYETTSMGSPLCDLQWNWLLPGYHEQQGNWSVFDINYKE